MRFDVLCTTAQSSASRRTHRATWNKLQISHLGEEIQVLEKALVLPKSSGCQVCVGGVDIGEPDKYPVGNSHEETEVCLDDSLDLKLAGLWLHNSWCNNKQFPTEIQKQLAAWGCLFSFLLWE